MALSNIFREPRREITESIVGLVVVGVFVVADYHFAIWFEVVTGGTQHGCPWPIGMAFGVGLAVLLVILVFAVHEMGEGICNALDRAGVRLRPTERYRGP